ncbi:glycosyltransferase family 4 protein [Clostridium perfringens]|uniref:Capsular polysaccharide biosynthesis protein n=1 Tax=Clostridium perfringens E str. JGS1987 TaxID=451755 RepID=B1BNI9_CLOPF|nr:glycosyltransferase family 4 protein [Clostridium perfringens]EDT16739.1 capsular polysaccharide biosynthesis protein [Clostridium perfringens E str. JGS1987]EJT6558967.1 glycosyltransferase family 4 protein [Clostridium perfringens]EJT6560085.1 glycosyltransferase family 4 protein [Clostridium perfringens]ELC8459845.1 glycosyltransferase family 4 protein [Clostridium perfringens]ELC8460942.1 glycosyltransferase family 4 protein [Clostridium perfringens]
MKKILYVTTVSRTINAFLIPHIEMLIENKYEVNCACYIDREIDKRLIKKSVKIYNIPFSRNPLSLDNLKAFNELIKIQEENQYDMIHVHTPIASIYGRLLKLKFKNLKTIYTAHGYHFFKNGPKMGWILYYPIEKLMAKLTDVTININKEDFEITKKKLKPKKAYLINGVGLNINEYSLLSEGERNKKRRVLGLKDDDFVVIMIAELNGNKNQMQLVRAIELLKNKYQNIKCLIVGEGKKLQFLKKEVKKRSLEKNIVFLGFRKDVNELINASDIGVLFSYREGLPRNLMEIMANGKRIVATNIRGNRDIVCNKFIGALVEVNDYEATAKAIEKFYLTSANKNKILKEVESYSILNILTELSSIYDSLQEGGNYNEKMSSYITNE